MGLMLNRFQIDMEPQLLLVLLWSAAVMYSARIIICNSHMVVHPPAILVFYL